MQMGISDSPLFLRGELDIFRWLRVWLVGDWYLFNRLSQDHPLTLRQFIFSQLDICLAVVQSQVSRKGYHTKTFDGTLQLIGLCPYPLLLLNNAVNQLAALRIHRYHRATFKLYHILSREGSIHLLDRQCFGNLRMAANLWLIDTADIPFLDRLRGM